jgi:hypothetical protein
MDGLQIRITRCIVIGRLSKQQQAISGKRANVWGVSEWPLRMSTFLIQFEFGYVGIEHDQRTLSYLQGYLYI